MALHMGEIVTMPETCVQDHVSTFVSVTSLDIFNESLKQFAVVFEP